MTHTAPYQQKSKALSALSIAGVALTLGLAGCSNSETTDTAASADGAATESQNIELLNVSYALAASVAPFLSVTVFTTAPGHSDLIGYSG